MKKIIKMFLKNNTKNNYSPYIVVHIPKTAGTSFRVAIQESINKSSILFDYGEHSKKTSKKVLNFTYGEEQEKLPLYMFNQNIKFLIGHFSISKYYESFPNARFCTFLRHPIQRVISEYKHKQKLNDYKETFQTFYSQKNQINRQYSLLQGMNLDQLFCFGLTEEYDKSIRLFNKMTGSNLQILELNLGKKNIQEKYELDEGVYKALKQLNDKDIQLYEEAKNLFYKKLQEYGIE